jgi:hypothetical protein
MLVEEPVFTQDAVRIIWNEIRSMEGGQGVQYKGVAFESWYGKPISVLYAISQHSFSGQNQTYPYSHWISIALAMNLIGRLAHRYGCNDVVRLSDGHNSTRWAIYPHQLGEGAMHKLQVILERVDQVLLQFEQPLDFTEPTAAQPLGACSRCGPDLVRDDGGDGFRCSEGCLL